MVRPAHSASYPPLRHAGLGEKPKGEQKVAGKAHKKPEDPKLEVYSKEMMRAFRLRTSSAARPEDTESSCTGSRCAEARRESAVLTIRSCVLPFPPPRVPIEVAAGRNTSMYRMPWMEGTPSEVPGADTSKDPVANPAAVKTMAKVFGYDVETQGAEEMKYTLMQVAVVATVVRAQVGICDSHARASAVPKLTCNPHACSHRT